MITIERELIDHSSGILWPGLQEIKRGNVNNAAIPRLIIHSESTCVTLYDTKLGT